MPIKIVGPPTISNTGYFVSKAIFKGNATFRSSYVANVDINFAITKIDSDSDYIGIISYGSYVKNKSTLSATAIKNSKGTYVLPSTASITDGSYNPFSRYFYMELQTATVSTKTKPFVHYVLSSAGQALVVSLGWISLSPSVIKQNLKIVGY